MKKLYRFSPIENESDFEKVLEYLASELDKLSKELFNKQLPVTTLKIFPHYPEEYDYLHKLISGIGSKASFSSDTSFYVQVDKKVAGHNIKYIGVRIVDPYRLHVGCGDYEIDNFEEFKKQHISSSQFIRNIKDDMIELWHPNFDVLGYVVPAI